MVIGLLKERLNETIIKHGIGSKEVYNASVQVDEEIIKYYQNTQMKYYYLSSVDALNRYIDQEGKRPTISEWNLLAKKEGYLCSKSLHYIGKIQLL